MYSFISNTAFYSLLSLILLTNACQKTNSSNTSNNQENFNDLFTLVDSTHLEGTSEHPVYSVHDMITFEENYFILDQQNFRVLKFDKDGKFLARWGTEGKGPGEFTRPEKIVLDEDGHLYVLDGSGSFEIQKFDQSGNELNTYTIESFGPFLETYITDINNT